MTNPVDTIIATVKGWPPESPAGGTYQRWAVVLVQEIESLRADNALAIESLAKQQDEIERLTRELSNATECRRDDAHYAEQNERLRAALEEIKNWGDASMDGEPCTWCTNHPAACAIKIAREALSGEPPSPAEPEAQCICPPGGYDSYCKVHGVLNQQSPEKSGGDDAAD